MDLIQLEYFKAVAEAGHLTNAAKKLNVAQPALSVSIAKLENEVGVPLFDRVGRGIYLNKTGEIYLEYVEQALSIMKRAQTEVDAYCKKLDNVLNLGVVSKPFSQMQLVDFKSRFPNSDIRQIDIESEHMVEALQKDELDYVLAGRMISAPGIVGEQVWEEKMVLAVSADHPLARYEWIRLCDASEEKFICLPKGFEYRILADEMCREAGFSQNVTVECFHCHMVGLVAAGEGVALMTTGRAKGHRGNKQVVFVPIMDPEYTRKHYIMWKVGHHFNKMAKEFRRYLKTYFEEHGSDGCGDCGL